ncbi:MAG: ABC transporter ATP-binding protein [Lachnospiraceae bacterium]|nr:ABC transporter ATP-binding protein [Lachnospiraceae bacterium]
MQKLREKWMCLKEIGIYARKDFYLSGLLGLISAIIQYLYIEVLNRLYSLLWAKDFGSRLWLIFFALVGCILVSDLMNGFTNMVFEYLQTNLEKGFIQFQIFRAKNMEPEQCLQKEILDAQQNVKGAIDSIILYYYRFSNMMFNHLPYYIFVTIFLIRMDWRIAVVMFITFLPAILTWKIRRNANLEVAQKVGEKKRQMQEYEKYNTTLPALYETRYFSMQHRFYKRFSDAVEGYQKLKKGYYRRVCGLQLVTDGLHLLGIGIILGFIVYMVSNHQMNGAQVATVLTVLLSMYDSIENFMKNTVSILVEHGATVQVVADYAKMTAVAGGDRDTDFETGAEAVQDLHTVSLSHVYYHYPDAEKNALKDISLSLHAGEVLAVVGENGSGKTTLSRVLGGFLPPKDGKLTANGIAIADENKRDYRKKISAVFQDFQRYPLTLRENICFGEADAVSTEEFAEILKEVQLSEKNPDIVLSKEFGGEEYSGGQWQRVAIARGNFKKSELLIFDEPTSAIDPLEEVRIMKLLLSLCKDKMAVLVTHRIGAATLADYIAVMKDGELVEYGTHGELLERRGEYFRMYEAQKQWYV